MTSQSDQGRGQDSDSSRQARARPRLRPREHATDEGASAVGAGRVQTLWEYPTKA